METQLHQHISNWLKNYLEIHEQQSFIVGVSGGIDSAVTSTLCARTGIKTYVLNLPIHSKTENTNLSSVHCDWLESQFSNVEALIIDATDAFDVFARLFKDLDLQNGLASANSKSRLRMMILYYIATTKHGIVVGTGNKVEDFGVGFYTKYGDGGVDISPIADLTKTQVRAIAKELKIFEEIINAPPTDGLWEDSRTDEEQIGASYEELEWAMEYLAHNDKICLTSRQKEVINIYNTFHNKNKHKMLSIPVFNVSALNKENL